MSPRFIVAGPIDGLYHVLYKSRTAKAFGPISHHVVEADAIREMEMLNAEQVIHENELPRNS